jgi:general stress protein 26
VIEAVSFFGYLLTDKGLAAAPGAVILRLEVRTSMTKTEILGALDEIIDHAQVGVLATTDQDGRPSMRWMTPAQVRGRQGYLYAVTSPGFRKIRHIESQPGVEWMFQTPDLNRIVTVRGRISILDNPQLKSEVLESIGRRLEVFWRVNDKTEFVVLETAIEQVSIFDTMKRHRESALMGKEDRL